MNRITLNVLVVDDEQGMTSGAERCLRRFIAKDENIKDEISFAVSTASSGKEALDFLEKNNVDIMLLDYKLPDMNGIEILEKVSDKKILTIVITAFASLDVAITATKKGAFDFLAKPFTPEELRNSVRKAATSIYSMRMLKILEEEKKSIRFEFISVLAHELKSPISAVEGYLKLIDERIKGNDVSAYDTMIKRSIERLNSMRKLIIDIIDLTKLESNRKVRNIERINLAQSVKSIVDGFENQAKERNIKIITDIKDVFINADAGDIEMLVSNMVSNGIKYNKDGGEVKIIVDSEGEFTKLIFSDTGIGIKQEDLDKLFKEFVRIKNEQTRTIEGSGLGLSIVKKIVDFYDGKINIESEFGKGTSFTLYLKSKPPCD
ncbi:MAG: ATP-binding protein [Acidobacteriota bacterium]